VIDIVVCFRTTYVNPTTGDEIWSPSMIARNYLLSVRFYIDVISSLPLDYFKLGTGVLGDLLSLISMFKIVRVTRISRIISNLNVKQDLKAMLKVVYLILLLFLYIHVFACFFYYVVIIEYDYIPTLDFIYGKTTMYEQNNTYKYFLMLYYAVMAFGRNDVTPRSNLELAFIGYAMILSAMFNAFIFGTISDLVSQMRKKTIKVQENMDTANTSMNNLKIPK
jgi:hypothetical protein